MTKQCNNCYYHDVCPDKLVCDDYAPIYDDTDAIVNELIEEERHNFYIDWAEYINEYND